jgi:hypothetical protein
MNAARLVFGPDAPFFIAFNDVPLSTAAATACPGGCRTPLPPTHRSPATDAARFRLRAVPVPNCTIPHRSEAGAPPPGATAAPQCAGARRPAPAARHQSIDSDGHRTAGPHRVRRRGRFAQSREDSAHAFPQHSIQRQSSAVSPVVFDQQHDGLRESRIARTIGGNQQSALGRMRRLRDNGRDSHPQTGGQPRQPG